MTFDSVVCLMGTEWPDDGFRFFLGIVQLRMYLPPGPPKENLTLKLEVVSILKLGNIYFK